MKELLKDRLAKGKLRRLREGTHLRRGDRFFDPAYARWFTVQWHPWSNGRVVGKWDDYRRPVKRKRK